MQWCLSNRKTAKSFLSSFLKNLEKWHADLRTWTSPPPHLTKLLGLLLWTPSKVRGKVQMPPDEGLVYDEFKILCLWRNETQENKRIDRCSFESRSVHIDFSVCVGDRKNEQWKMASLGFFSPIIFLFGQHSCRINKWKLNTKSTAVQSSVRANLQAIIFRLIDFHSEWDGWIIFS